MMKKNISKILITLVLVLASMSTIAFAAVDPVDKMGLLPKGNDTTGTIGPNTADTQDVFNSDELNAVRDLVDLKTTDKVFSTAIRLVLRFTMLLTLIAIIVAGVFYVISQGDDEKTKKAKDIILYLVIGMAVMAGSYGIVTGITNFKFLE